MLELRVLLVLFKFIIEICDRPGFIAKWMRASRKQNIAYEVWTVYRAYLSKTAVH